MVIRHFPIFATDEQKESRNQKEAYFNKLIFLVYFTFCAYYFMDTDLICIEMKIKAYITSRELAKILKVQHQK